VERAKWPVFWGACTLLALLPCAARAQGDTIEMNGTIVRLGMNQEEVLARLGEKNALRELVKGAGLWTVQRKEQAGLPCSPCGSVGFKDGKLYTATIEIGTAIDTTAAGLMNHLYMAIAQAEKSGIPIEIHTQPEAELKTQQRERLLSVFVGRKEYSIQIVQPVGISGPSFTTLSESVYEPQSPAEPARK
jgi:hypothetical protein